MRRTALAISVLAALALPAAAPRPVTVMTGVIESAETGKPIARALVELLGARDPETILSDRAAGRHLPAAIRQVETDEEGRFRLEAPPGGLYHVVASARGRQTGTFGRTFPTGSAASEQWLGSLALPAGRSLQGRVLDSAGKPAAGAQVHAQEDAPVRRGGGGGGSFFRSMSASAQHPFFPRLVETAADGSFSLEGLPHRAVTLRVYATGEAVARIEIPAAPSSAPVTVRLQQGIAISGRVVAPDGRSPVASAWVMAGTSGEDGLARTAKDGSFTLEHLRSADIALVASVARAYPAGTDPFPAPAFWGPSVPFKPAARKKGVPALTLLLRPGGVVRARLLDRETREPLEAASLRVTAESGEQGWTGTPGPDGLLVVGGLLAGSFSTFGAAAGYLDETLGGLPLQAGKPADVTLAMRPASSLAGTIRDAAGRPVAKATVTVLGPPPGLRALPIPLFLPLQLPPALSDTTGQFRVEGLPSRAELQLRVEAGGFAPREVKGFLLKPGEKRDGVEILLENGLAVTGRVIGPDGKPVAGASVAPTRGSDSSPGGGMVIRVSTGGPGSGGRGGARRPGNPFAAMDEPIPEAVTDAQGVFRAAGARPGIWSIAVQAAGFAPKTVSGLKLQEGDRSLDAGDIRLEPAATIRGRLQTASGAPVPLAQGSVRKDFAELSSFASQPDGYFTAGDLTPGETVTLTIDAEGYASIEKGGLTPPVEDLVLTLLPSSRVKGQVLDRESRQPIPDFSVGVSRSRSGGGGGAMMQFRMGGPQTPFHDEDGRFTVEDIDPGKVTVTASAPGYREAALSDLEVPEGSDLEGLVFTLERSVSVSGIVTDDRGRPLAAAVVEKKEASGGMMGVRFAGGAGSASTDGEGRFALLGLERGPVTLTVSHPDYEPLDREVDASRDVEGLRFSLSRGGTISGMVLREEDGTGVAGASVMAQAAGGAFFAGGRAATAGQDGSFTLEGIPSGRYTVRAEAPGLRSGSAEGVVVAQGATPPPVEIRLGGGVTVSGSLVNVREEELPQFTVRAFSGGIGGPGATAPVDASGRFELKGLGAGPVTLVAQSGIFGGRSLSKPIEIPAGVASYETTIEFPRGSTVEGTVLRGGKGIGGATVIFMHETAGSSVSATTDSGGRYRVEGLDAGDYRVMVMDLTSGLNHSIDATVRSDTELDIEIPLARITGYVTDAATGDPLEGASLEIAREGAPATTGFIRFQSGVRTDASGFFSFENLEEGVWTITARGPGYGMETQSIRIAPGAKPDDVTIALSPSEGFAFRAVDAASGQPLRSIAVVALAGGGGDPLSAAGEGTRTVLNHLTLNADAAGLFRLGSLQPGLYRLVLGGQGLATTTLHGVAVPAAETTYELGRGGTLRVTVPGLTGNQTAKAVLLDAQGRPMHANAFFAAPTFTLKAGAAQEVTDLPAGSWRLRVALPGGARLERSVTLTDGGITQVTLQ